MEQEVLVRLRALRAKMKKQNPGVLEDIRSSYEKAQKLAEAKAVQEKQPDITTLPPDAEIPIDREKNMRTVAAFLKLRGISMDELKRPH